MTYQMKNRCSNCKEYFVKFQCGQATHGECDCPICQGYCECYKLKDYDKAVIELMKLEENNDRLS